MRSFIFLLLIIPQISFGQSTSLYNANRKLTIDTTFQIDSLSFENIKDIEAVLLGRIYNQVKYPEIAKENGQEGIVIVEISIGANSKDYTYKIAKSGNEIFKKDILAYFENLSEYVKGQISPKVGTILFYIPIKFEIRQNDFGETLKTNRMITIGTNAIAPETIILRH